MKVNKEWLEEYNKKKSIMCPENSLEKYFTDKEIEQYFDLSIKLLNGIEHLDDYFKKIKSE